MSKISDVITGLRLAVELADQVGKAKRQESVGGDKVIAVEVLAIAARMSGVYLMEHEGIPSPGIRADDLIRIFQDQGWVVKE